MRPPKGWTEFRATYGDIRPYIRPDGELMAAQWERLILTPLVLPAPLPLGWDPDTRVIQIRCHRLVKDSLERVFGEIYRAGHWGLLESFDGCYNFRTQRGARRTLSTHCWGVAIDLNAKDDPQGDPQIDQPEGVVWAFEGEGWTWGGRFAGGRVDAMHFQFASGL